LSILIMINRIRPQVMLTVFLLLANREITAQAVTDTTSAPAVAVRFNAERAMNDLVKQVEFGPRLPESPGIRSTRHLITETLSTAGWQVETQDFRAYSPMLAAEVPGQNIFAIYPKQTTPTLIISAHYDTRPFADRDPDPARREDPVPGANDAGSGVAVLLELGRILPQAGTTRSVGFVFFDLEDHGTPADENGFCLGSRYFASNLPAQIQQFQQGINLDMVATPNIKLAMEGNSVGKAPQLTYDLWKVGTTFHPDAWTMDRGPAIYDDHMPFLDTGKKYVDVIDLQYPPWHTTQDLPENCSTQSLEKVGDTILRFINH